MEKCCIEDCVLHRKTEKNYCLKWPDVSICYKIQCVAEQLKSELDKYIKEVI